MKVEKTQRGFERVGHPDYPPTVHGESTPLVQQSSAVGNYPDAFDRPGTSFLFIGVKHHLNREEVAELAAMLQSWLRTGSLEG